MNYEMLFLKCLLQTVLMETVVLLVLFRLVFRNKEIGMVRLLFAGFLASFATLPYLWFVLSTLVDQRIWFVLIGESFAVVMESFILMALLRIKYPRALLTSLICNLVSFSIGLLIN
jgi:hypothetical protein